MQENNKKPIPLPEEETNHPLFDGAATEFKEQPSGKGNDAKAAEVKASVEFLNPNPDAAQEVHAEEVKDDGPLFNQTTTIEKSNNNGLMTVDLMGDELPDLDEGEIIPLNMVSNYWTPETPGENKRVYFDCLQMEFFKQQGGEEDEVIELEAAYFFQKVNGVQVKFCNASTRLVAEIKKNHIQRGMPILITFMGKKKNSTNQYKSDMWAINPIRIKIR